MYQGYNALADLSDPSEYLTLVSEISNGLARQQPPSITQTILERSK